MAAIDANITEDRVEGYQSAGLTVFPHVKTSELVCFLFFPRIRGEIPFLVAKVVQTSLLKDQRKCAQS